MTFSTNFKKPRILEKVRHHIKRQKAVESPERARMNAVRREDQYCRFPLCGCRRLKLTLEVAHTHHRGMGGNAKLDRTVPEKLILLCQPRHRKHQFSLDKKTLRVEPLTARGMRGPVRWLIDATECFIPESCARLENSRGEVVPLLGARLSDVWFVVAAETSPHHFEPFTEAQSAILKHLATMTC